VWFASYQDLLVGYAKAAQAAGVEYFSVGDELNSLQDDPSWSSLIGAVRSVYHGAVTYCSNWDTSPPAFSSSLDLVGIDAYYPLSAQANPSVSQLIDAWQQWIPHLVAAHQVTGKPVVICEMGITAWANAFQAPWTSQPPPGTPWAPAEEAAYYQASITATEGAVTGWYWWDTEIANPITRPPLSSPQFDLLGLPAEQVLAQNYQRLQR
jgi:hypothetical protein